MDDWIRYSDAIIAEAWRELLPHLLAGRAVRLVVNASAGEPLRVETSQFYKGRNWPAGTNQPAIT